MLSVTDRLLNDPILAKCSPEALSRLILYVEERLLTAGEMVYQAGSPADGLYLATTGEVRLETPSGAVLCCGEGALGVESVTDSAVYLTSAIAIVPTRIIYIPREYLLPLLANQPRLKSDLTLKLLEWITTHPLLKQLTKRPTTVAGQDKPSESFLCQVGWLLTILLPLTVLWATQYTGMDRNTSMFLAIFTATVTMWVFPIMDDYLPGIFAVMAILISGLAPSTVVLAGFTSDGFLMAMSILALSTVITTSGLGYRAILLLLRYLPNSRFWHNFGLTLVGMLLTPLIPSANGRVALITPLYEDITRNLGFAENRPATTQLAVSAFSGVTLLSAVFISSKSVNFAVFSLLPTQAQDHFQGSGWVIAAGASALFLILCQGLSTAITFRSPEQSHLSKERVAAQLTLLGRLQGREWAALVGILVLVVGIATPSLHGIQAPWLGLTVLYGLLLFGCLSKTELREKTDWPFLLYLVGLTCLVGTFNYLHLDQQLARSVPWLGVYMRDNFNLFILVLFGLICLMRLAVPISATIVILASLLVPLADIYGINPWIIGFIILVFGEVWFLPYQCSYYLQIQVVNQHRLLYREKSFLIHNVMMSLARLGAIYVSIPYWKSIGLL